MPRALKIIYAGTPEFAVTALEALLSASQHHVCAVYTQPDRPAGRGRELKASPVKQIALQHAIPVYQPASLKSPEAQAELHALQADETVFVVLGRDIAAEATLAGALLAHEGTAGTLECIQVKVQVNAAHRLRAAVAPGQLLLADDGVLDRVQAGID